MLERVKKRMNVLIWGTASATCAECGVAVSPAKAIWSGREAYCSVEHELRDHDDAGWTGAAAPLPVTGREVRAAVSATAPAYPHAA